MAALPVPEEYDGFGASLVETAVVLEELGRNLTPSPLLAVAIATAALLSPARTDDARRDLLAAGSPPARWRRTSPSDELVLDADQAAILVAAPRRYGLAVLEVLASSRSGCSSTRRSVSRARRDRQDLLGTRSRLDERAPCAASRAP